MTSRRHRSAPWAALAATPIAAAIGWLLYSATAIDHDRQLAAAVPGDRFEVETPAGRVAVTTSGPAEGVPLLLVHSINAAASSYEVRPLYLRQRIKRPVYAVDLPGFGLSERRDQLYTPRVMADALHAVVEAVAARHGGAAVDAIALSLSCEYLARAALERPLRFRSLGFISPTGFDDRLAGNARAQANRGNRFALDAVSVPLWSRGLFDLVVSRPSMRYFLEKTWGAKNIDEGLLDYGHASAHRPGAQHAVWCFLAGFLFAADVSRLYRALRLPVWEVHGVRGDFVDYHREREVTGRANWTTALFETGAFPHFERPDAVDASYDAFLAAL